MTKKERHWSGALPAKRPCQSTSGSAGNLAKLVELLGCLADLSQSFWFNIVTP